MDRPKIFEASTATQVIRIPDIEIEEDDLAYDYLPLRGYGYILAVENLEEEIIGWIKVEKLGCDSAKEWLEKNPYHQER